MSHGIKWHITFRGVRLTSFTQNDSIIWRPHNYIISHLHCKSEHPSNPAPVIWTVIYSRLPQNVTFQMCCNSQNCWSVCNHHNTLPWWLFISCDSHHLLFPLGFIINQMLFHLLIYCESYVIIAVFSGGGTYCLIWKTLWFSEDRMDAKIVLWMIPAILVTF